MNHEISKHALEELGRRRIPVEWVRAVLESPDQIVPEHGDVVCYQSKVVLGGATYLMRVMVNPTRQPPRVVTVYRTSKIAKYWSPT